VEVDRRLAYVPCDAVVIDNEQGARIATEHLLALGHRRIGLLVVKSDLTSDVGRLRGYRAALAGAGVAADERLVMQIEPDAPDTEQRVGTLVDERPTAIFAANNVLTECAWRLLRRRGLHLPDDMSLVGFDDVPWMEMVDPGITVIAQPTADLGRWAASLLLRRTQDGVRPPHVECLEPTLVVRGSTAPPPA
jgi:LacI family transcriptional regulator